MIPGRLTVVVSGAAVARTTDRPEWIDGPEREPFSRAGLVRVVSEAFIFIGVPILALWVRGACWESWVASIVVVAVLLAVLRLSRSGHVLRIVVFTMVSLVALLGWSALTFHSLNLFSTPSKIMLCGRMYNLSQSSVRPGANQPHVHQIGVDPAGNAILGSAGSMLGGNCLAGTLLIDNGNGSYGSYDLSGGP